MNSSATLQPDTTPADQLTRWRQFDSGLKTDHNGVAQIQLLIQNIHCSSCVNKIDKALANTAGVCSVSVDAQTGLSTLRWKPTQCALSQVLLQLRELGFQPHVLHYDAISRHIKEERNDLLKRLAVAGIGMMQVMMYVVGTYFGDSQGMEPAIERLLFFVAMVVATPVVFYSGAPFLKGAWLSLRAGLPSMDVPVTLALLLAYGASCFNFFSADGPMYFESATMFVFLLLLSRWVTLQVRHQSIDASMALLSMLPDTAIRIVNGKDERVPIALLAPGDLLRTRPGETVAADGIITEGKTCVDESLLTGESDPHSRGVGDAVIAGSINCDGTFVFRVTAMAQSSRIAQITELLMRTQQQKTAGVQLANRVASYFVSAVLLLACIVYATWLLVDAERAFPATLAVLVVTCPCALALAIPAALSAGATKFAHHGLLISNLDVLSTIPKITHVLFDKTGTLSVGRPVIKNVRVNAEHPDSVTPSQLLAFAAALEKHSSHPLATAFSGVLHAHEAVNVEVFTGQGLQGQINDRQLKIGNAEFIGYHTQSAEVMHMGDQNGVLGSIDLEDPWRDDVARVISGLHREGIQSLIVSGDNQDRVNHAVRALGLSGGEGGLQPDEKLQRLRKMQADNNIVLAIGDGVNDAALLAGADVSVALASGADLAQAGADILLTSERLHALTLLFGLARQVRHVIRQNLAWAVVYNAIAVPSAALGFIGPGLAALGMSISSLIVVSNAARLARSQTGMAGTNSVGTAPHSHHASPSTAPETGVV